MSTNHRAVEDLDVMSESTRRAHAEQRLWSTLGVLFRWRRFIIAVTGSVAVAAVVISLLLPNWYRASTRLLLPEGSGSGLLSLLDNVSPLAAGLLGGGGDHVRYFAILSSRAVCGAIVDRFDLVEVYQTQEDPNPREAAIHTLLDNTEFAVDQEYEYISVNVLDTDPQRAADIANAFVEELGRVNNRLSSQSASNFRRYVEDRYAEAQATVDSLLDAAQAFQQTYGVFDLPTQAESFLTQVAELRVNATQAEIEYEALLNQYGPDNPQVRAYRDVAQAANRKYTEALRGQEELLPVSRSDMPGVLRRHIDLERELVIQRSILETVAPIREQARFDEERTIEAVQVVDAAIPPARKDRPKRSVIVVAATLSGFLLTVVFVLLFDWWQARHAYIAHRIYEAARKPRTTRVPESS